MYKVIQAHYAILEDKHWNYWFSSNKYKFILFQETHMDFLKEKQPIFSHAYLLFMYPGW